MPNPLQSSEPPVNEPGQQPQGNPLQSSAPPGGPMPTQQQAPPVLSHQEAVAALRHFHAVQDELETLMKNAAFGKSDIKSSIIDGTTKLVANRMITPAAAVVQLSSVPEKPMDQAKWVQDHYQQTMAAQGAIIEHHRAAGPGTGDWAVEGQQTSDPSNHIELMSGVMGRYKGPK